MDASVRRVDTKPTAPGSRVRRSARQRKDDEHTFEEALGGEHEPRSTAAANDDHENGPRARPAAHDDEPGSTLDLLG